MAFVITHGPQPYMNKKTPFEEWVIRHQKQCKTNEVDRCCVFNISETLLYSVNMDTNDIIYSFTPKIKFETNTAFTAKFEIDRCLKIVYVYNVSNITRQCFYDCVCKGVRRIVRECFGNDWSFEFTTYDEIMVAKVNCLMDFIGVEDVCREIVKRSLDCSGSYREVPQMIFNYKKALLFSLYY
jgi:hypothetical protein